MKKTLTATLIAASLALSACDSDDDDDSPSVDPTDPTAESSTFQITFTNLSNQLLTRPVVAIHDSSIHLFQIGEVASDPVRDIAETGADAELVAFATDAANADVVSAAGVAGDGVIDVPFFTPGQTATLSLTTDQADHVFSAVNMVICTNDAIAGFDSISLPTGTEPLTMTAVVYDAGTRQNQQDSNTFFPGPCREPGVDVVEAPEEDPRQAIGPHAGYAGLVAPSEGPATGLDFTLNTGDSVLQVEIVRN